MTADAELLLIDETVLNGRVMLAVADFLDGHYATAAKQLVQAAISGQQFQMALKSSFVGERTTAQYLANSSNELLNGKLPEKLIADTGERIRDREAIRKRQTETILNPFLVIFFVFVA